MILRQQFTKRPIINKKNFPGIIHQKQNSLEIFMFYFYLLLLQNTPRTLPFVNLNLKLTQIFLLDKANRHS